MKNIGTYVFVTIVSLVMVVATAFLMTAADEPIRQAGMYLPLSSVLWLPGAPPEPVCWRWTTRSTPPPPPRTPPEASERALLSFLKLFSKRKDPPTAGLSFSLFTAAPAAGIPPPTAAAALSPSTPTPPAAGYPGAR